MQGIAHSYIPNPQHKDDYALKRLDLNWEDGGAYALLGPSGCGKTTLLNIISGLLDPSQGEILFDEKKVNGLHTRERNIAQVFQFPVIYDTMTVYENLAFPLKNRKVSERRINIRVQEIAEILDITPDLNKRASGLNADIKQIISLGRGLVREDVSAILFDEPLTVIDPHVKWLIRRQLKQIHEQLKLTMIYVTHDQLEALTFADKVNVMLDGAVLQQGTPQDLFEAPAHTYVGYFIGSPGMNILPCTIDNGHAIVEAEKIKIPAVMAKAGEKAKGPLKLGIRPEFTMVTSSNNSDATPIRIKKVETLGNYRIVTAMLGKVIIKIKVSEKVQVNPDANNKVIFNQDNMILYENDKALNLQ